MEISTLINAYIDVNILLAVSLALWLLARGALKILGLPHAYTTQIRLLSVVFVATLISPVFDALYGLVANAGLLARPYSVNVSDFVVAQYLNGSFEMTPSAFEEFLGLRGRIVDGIANLNTAAGIAIIAFLAAGFAFSALRLALGFYRLRRIVSVSIMWRQFGSLELRVSDTVSIPFSTRTWARRIIVVPSSILQNPADLKIALGHEFQHLRQNDLEWEIALELLRPLFFWNPAFALWKRKFEELRELSCDQKVLARRTIGVATYCNSLLSICEDSLKPKRLFAVEVPRVALAETRVQFLGRSSKTLLRHRLNSLLDGNLERHPRTVFALFLVPLLAVTLLGSVAIQKPGDWSYDRLMLSTIVNLERLAKYNGPTTFAQVGQ